MSIHKSDFCICHGKFPCPNPKSEYLLTLKGAEDVKETHSKETPGGKKFLELGSYYRLCMALLQAEELLKEAERIMSYRDQKDIAMVDEVEWLNKRKALIEAVRQ